MELIDKAKVIEKIEGKIKANKETIENMKSINLSKLLINIIEEYNVYLKRLIEQIQAMPGEGK